MNIVTLCVYCGANAGHRPAYLESARTLARWCAGHGIGLVYGGGRAGLMGALADAALAAGGRVTGVMPHTLAEQELAHDGLSELLLTHSMHERKQLMASRADAFVALPGGVGTLEELFEIWTWTQLGFQSKPCGVLNVEGYYDRLLAFLDHTVAEGYVQEEHRRILCVGTEPAELFEQLRSFQAPRPAWRSSSET